MSITLHDAVKKGNLKAVFDLCTKLNVNERDVSGNTPLLLAILVEEESIYNEILHVLIQRGADVHVANRGFTALYHAVFYQRIEAIKILLKAGAWLNTNNQKYELHLAAQRGDKGILELFLNHPKCTKDMINFADEDGRTSTYFAAANCHKTTLKILIKHGGVLSSESKYGTVFDAIFDEVSQPAQFLQEVFSSHIHLKKSLVYGMQKKIYNIDFSVLASNTSERQMTVISNLLAAASDEEKTEVLQHPLIELYLSLKWRMISRFFYWWIIVYILFAVSIGIYVTLLVNNYDKHFPFIRNITIIILFLTSFVLLAHGLLQSTLVHRNYVKKYEMWSNLICVSFSFIVAILAFNDLDKGGLEDCPNWVLHVTSTAVLLAWIELMLLIGRLPTFGCYTLMFAAVLQNVIKVLLTFLCLVIGFSLSFSIQFHNFEQFNNPWRAMVKTAVMMMGEFEYANLFADDRTQKFPFRLSATSVLIFFSFIILTNIVLMNLMIGLAVSDIQGLQKESLARKLEKQAEFLGQVEEIAFKILNSKYFSMRAKRLFIKKTFISLDYEIQTSARFQRSRHLPRRLIDSIVAIGKKNYTKN